MSRLSWFNRHSDLTRAAQATYRLLEPGAKLSYGGGVCSWVDWLGADPTTGQPV